jgi:hypothetical protein
MRIWILNLIVMVLEYYSIYPVSIVGATESWNSIVISSFFFISQLIDWKSSTVLIDG